MKLNFWQILGAVLILVGLVYVIFFRKSEPTTPNTGMPQQDRSDVIVEPRNVPTTLPATSSAM